MTRSSAIALPEARMRSRNPNKQGGVAALVVTMTLFFAMLLVLVAMFVLF